MTKRDADSWSGLGDLGDAVKPRALARSAHDHKVPHAEVEGELRSPFAGTHGEAPGVPKRDRGNDRIDDAPGNVISVPGDGVATVAVEVRAHRIEFAPVPVRDQLTHPVDDPREIAVAWRVGPAGDQTRRDDHFAVQLLSCLLPRSALHQLFEQCVSPGEPAPNVVRPRGRVELMPDQSGEFGIGAGFALSEQRWLPGSDLRSVVIRTEGVLGCLVDAAIGELHPFLLPPSLDLKTILGS